MLKTATQTLFCLFSLTALGSAAPIYYLSTGQTGAQTQIDIAHTSSWLLNPNVDFSFAGGLFTMKAGGKGLGLYISRELITACGGTLGIASGQQRKFLPAWATGAAFISEFKEKTKN